MSVRQADENRRELERTTEHLEHLHHSAERSLETLQLCTSRRLRSCRPHHQCRRHIDTFLILTDRFGSSIYPESHCISFLALCFAILARAGGTIKSSLADPLDDSFIVISLAPYTPWK